MASSALVLQEGSFTGRYKIAELLGRGGMAVVHRAIDEATGRHVALKQFTLPSSDPHAPEAAALFEKEFHTLAELSHPRIVEVYDYGITEAGPYYTMELLDGGDLRERSPVPWREACSLLYDVCSSLALLHSRRLVHRDVSPRNIRCTRDGRAKLIDFGAMIPVGSSGFVVGTPPFLAPEVVYGSAIDARVDLYSVGAALYYAITGRNAYPAREIVQLFDSWQTKPLPPSTWVEGTPHALDVLVSSLLDLEPAMRPRTAFEVMERLAAVAELDRVEQASVSRAFLSTPTMVGRQALVAALREQLDRSFAGRGRGVLISADKGAGRSRSLDAAGLTAKALGATVLRASAATARGNDLAVAITLVTRLLQLLPTATETAARAAGRFDALFDASVKLPEGNDPAPSRAKLRLSAAEMAKDGRSDLEAAFVDLILDVARDNAIAILVDDFARVDERSAALLATLVTRADLRRLSVVVTADAADLAVDGTALSLFARDAAQLTLSPLTLGETEELLGSMFGDVPNLGVVSRRVYDIAGGNPRDSMDVVQHLVDKGRIRYEGGSWTLPNPLDAADLPPNAEAAIRARLATLGLLARTLAESQALATRPTFTREDYRRLAGNADRAAVDRAISELVSQHAVVSDGHVHTLAHEGWRAALLAGLGADARQERHSALVALSESRVDATTVHHLLAAGRQVEALDRLGELLATVTQSSDLYRIGEMNAVDVATTFEHALDVAKSLGRRPRELHEIRRWLVGLSIAADDRFYFRAADDWLARLKHDAGFDLWEGLADVEDSGTRLMRALGQAKERYSSTPEEARVYRPDEAIRGLVQFVVMSIAIGSRSMNVALLDSLPGLLAPFVSLSPAIDVIWQNALATRETRCYAQPEKARLRWMQVYERLGTITVSELPYVHAIRDAVASGIGSCDANLGLKSAMKWAELIANNPLQQVNALYIKKSTMLQQGDWERAEGFRKEAEVLSLNTQYRQMFANSLPSELASHSLADDLTGVKHVGARIAGMAQRSSGWECYRILAEAHYERIRGNREAARLAYTRCLERSAPDTGNPSNIVAVWPAAGAGMTETLLGLSEYEQAREFAENVLSRSLAAGIGALTHEVSRALALAEARLGHYDQAVRRLDAIIDEQTAFGVIGLLLGASYEARARIAIWAGDEAAVQLYGRRTAREYRHGAGCPVGARYERLMDEARSVAPLGLPNLSEFEMTKIASSRIEGPESASVVVTRAMRGTATREQRAERALDLICGGERSSGFLFLLDDSAGLELVASRPSPAASGETRVPSAELMEFVTAAVDRELSASAGVTMMVADAALLSRENPNTFTTEAGERHELFFLTSAEADSVRYAGVAVICVPGKGARSIRDTLIVTALGAHLVRSGTVAGVRARSS